MEGYGLRKKSLRKYIALLTAFVFILGSVGMAFADTVYVGNVGFDMDKMVNDDTYNEGFNDYFATHTNDPFIVDMAGMTFDVAAYLNAPDGTSMPDFAASDPAEVPAEAIVWDGEGEPGEPVEKLTVENVEAINANQISVKFEGMEEAVTIDLDEALVEGENEITFTYKDQEFTTTVTYEAPTGLAVKSVSAIDANGVTVTFAELSADLLGQEVEVKDANGDVYAVKAADLAEGAKSYTFEFVKTVASTKLVGVWNVNGVSFDLDLENNLAAFVAAGTDQIKLNKALTDLGIENVKVENMKAYADAHAAFLADLAKEDKDVDVAAIQGFVDKVNADQITAGDSKAIAKKVNDAIEADNDVALLAALKDPAFVRVNADWLTGLGSYKAAIVAEATLTNKDEVKEIQGLINGVNDLKVGAVTDTGIDKTVLTKAKDLVLTYNTPDAKGEQTSATKTKLTAINTQLALVDVLEATTPNNFKAKLTALAELVNTPSTTTVDMKKYVDANGQAYIDALKAEIVTTNKDEVSEVVNILFADTTGVNDVEEGKLITAVTTAADAEALVVALNDLGVKQVAATNEDAYYAFDGNGDLTDDYTAVTTKAEAQALVDGTNVDEVVNATASTIIEKLNVFGLDNIVAANAEAYVADANITGLTADVDNDATVTAVEAAVDAANKAVVIAAQVKAINEADDVATVKAALDALADVDEVADYLKIRSVDRDFVAAYVLENRPAAPGYANLGAIDADVTLAETDYSTALGNINGIVITDSIDTIVTALEDTLDEGYNALSNTAKVEAAEAFFDQLVFDDFGAIKTPFTTLAAVKALL